MKKLILPTALSFAMVACNTGKINTKDISVPEVDGLSMVKPDLSNLIAKQRQDVKAAQKAEAELAEKKQGLVDAIAQLKSEVVTLGEDSQTNTKLLEPLQQELSSVNTRLSEIQENLSVLKEQSEASEAYQEKLKQIEKFSQRVNAEIKLREKAIASAQESFRKNQELEDSLSFSSWDTAWETAVAIYKDWREGNAEKRERENEVHEKVIQRNLKSKQNFEEHLRKTTERWKAELAKLKEKINENAAAQIYELLQENTKKNQKLTELETEISELQASILNQDTLLRQKEQQIIDFEADLKELENTVSTAAVDTVSDFEAAKLELATKLAAGEKLTGRDLIDAILLQNIKSEQTTKFDLTSLKEELQTIAAASMATDAGKFKVNYEKEISKQHDGEELIYNSNYIQVQDPIEDNRVQCYSGTSLHLVLNEMQDLPMKNRVVIYTEGHVLPGYIMAHGKNLYLVGIETTASGTATINYGVTSDIGGEIRVYDAHQAMLVEIFKDSIQNYPEVVAQMQNTMKLYGFKPEQMKPVVFSNYDTNNERVLNSAMLGFGVSGETGGDKARKEISNVSNMNFRMSQKSKVPAGTEGVPGYEEEMPFYDEFVYSLESCDVVAPSVSQHFLYARSYVVSGGEETSLRPVSKAEISTLMTKGELEMWRGTFCRHAESVVISGEYIAQRENTAVEVNTFEQMILRVAKNVQCELSRNSDTEELELNIKGNTIDFKIYGFEKEGEDSLYQSYLKSVSKGKFSSENHKEEVASFGNEPKKSIHIQVIPAKSGSDGQTIFISAGPRNLDTVETVIRVNCSIKIK